MSSWLTPQGVTTIIFVLGLVLSLVANVAQRFQWTKVQAVADTATAHLGSAEKVLGVVVRGIERAKTGGGLPPEAVREVVEAIRTESQTHGTEPLLSAVVSAVQQDPTIAPADAGRIARPPAPAPADPASPRRVS
jgi:hypothetical protein